MNSFDLSLLLFPASIIFLFVFVISFYAAHSFTKAILAAFVKAGSFLLYFWMIFDGTYTFLDDWSYLDGGLSLSNADLSVLNFPAIFEAARSLAGGEHLSYYIYNAYAIRLFGPYYFSPVAFNVILTVFIAYLGKILVIKEFQVGKKQADMIYFFLLFHPDIFAWSNVMNGKDILVLLGHVILFISASLVQRKHVTKGLAIASSCSLVLLYTRFYVIFIFALAFFGGMLFSLRGKFIIKIISFFILYLVSVRILGIDIFIASYAKLRQYFVEPIYGIIRMMLTPIPFHTTESYAFLNIPSLIHWLLMPFLVGGIIRIYRMKTEFSRFFLLYLCCFLLLYGTFDELQGPRHRVQLDCALAILQFFGFQMMLRKKILVKRSASLHDSI